MVDKKCSDRMNEIILSEERAEDRALELFTLFNETHRTFLHKRWAEKVLLKMIEQVLKDNGLSMGGLLDIALSDPGKYKRAL